MLFISYSRKDAEIAEHYAHVLRASGHPVFIDKHSLDFGEDWKQQIADTIPKVDRLMLFWSKSAANSSNVTDEWRLALATPTCKIVPYIIDDTPLPADLQHLHGVTGFERVGRLARSRDVFGLWLKRLTQAAVLLMLIVIPAWWFLSSNYLVLMNDGARSKSPHIVEHRGAFDFTSPALQAPPLGDAPPGTANEPAAASSGAAAVALQVLLTLALLAVVAAIISVYLGTRLRRMQIRREIKRHALDAMTDLATGKQPPFTPHSCGASS